MKTLTVFVYCFVSFFVHGQTLLPLTEKVVYEVQVRDTMKRGSDYEYDWSWNNIEPSFRRAFLQRIEDTLLHGNLKCYTDAECTNQYKKNELSKQFYIEDTLSGLFPSGNDVHVDTLIIAVYSLCDEVANIMFNEQWRYDSINMKISKDVFSWGVAFQHRDYVGNENELVITDTAKIWIRNNQPIVDDWQILAPEYQYKHNLVSGCPQSFPHFIQSGFPNLKNVREYVFRMQDALKRINTIQGLSAIGPDTNNVLVCGEPFVSGNFPVYKSSLQSDIDTINICAPLSINFTEQWCFSPSTLALKKEITGIQILAWFYYERLDKVVCQPIFTVFFE